MTPPSLLSFATCLALIGFSPTSHAEEWQTFSPEGAGFSVQMPGRPSLKTTAKETILGTISEKLATTRYESGHFCVEYQTLPATAVELAGPNTLFDKARSAILNSSGASETAWSDTTVDGHPAKELDYAGGGTKGRSLLVLVGRKFYVLDVRGAGLPEADIEKFLNSFALD